MGKRRCLETDSGASWFLAVAHDWHSGVREAGVLALGGHFLSDPSLVYKHVHLYVNFVPESPRSREGHVLSQNGGGLLVGIWGTFFCDTESTD